MNDVAVSQPQPPAPMSPSYGVSVAAMTRDEFITAHRDRLFRPKGKQNFYVLPADREPFERNGVALPLMHRGYLQAGVTVEQALGTLYDETRHFGKDRKDEQKAREREARSADFRDKREVALAFYSGLDLDKFAQRFAELLGHPRSENQKRWVEDLLAAAYTGEFCDQLRIGNKKSKALFGEIFGIKLPNTDKGTREMLAERAPWPLPGA